MTNINEKMTNMSTLSKNDVWDHMQYMETPEIKPAITTRVLARWRYSFASIARQRSLTARGGWNLLIQSVM